MRAIINVAIGRRFIGNDLNRTPYENSIPRLKQSYGAHGQADKVIVYRTLPPDCPPHEEVPYAMKPYAVQDALNRGYQQIVWTDCSVYPVGSIAPIWDIIEERGYFFMADQHIAGEFMADSAVDLLGTTRHESFRIPMLTAAFFGLDFRKPLAREFLRGWMTTAKNGSFIGCHTNKYGQASRNHRVFGHLKEQTAASVLAYLLGFQLEDAAEWGIKYLWTDLGPTRPGPLRLEY
jgi:hypothetical protein